MDKEFKQRKLITANNYCNKAIIDVFSKTDELLHERIDTTFSGSTCVTVFFTPEKLVSANAGDSRAVLGSFINGSIN